MRLAHKIVLYLNHEQTNHLVRAAGAARQADRSRAGAWDLACTAGAARFAYNWVLAEWKGRFVAWTKDNSLPKPNEGALRRPLNKINFN